MNKAITHAKWFIKWAIQDEGAHYGLSHLKLQKILFYAQAHHLGRHETPLFPDEIQAWAHGPVVKSVYKDFRDEGWTPIGAHHVENFRWGTVNSDTAQFLIEMWDVYGGYSASKLRDFSHQPGTPWAKHFVQNVLNITIPQEEMMVYAQRVLGEPAA